MARQTLRAYASGSATVSTAAKAISHADFSWSAGELASADRAVVTAIAQPVNYLPDGGTPTATYGISVGANANATIDGNGNVQGTSFIRQGGTDSTVTVVLYKQEGA
jgi:hypothetical protein